MPQDAHRRGGAPGRPPAVARAAVEAAVRPLPELDDRLRYRAEFTADLTALRPLGQLRYAAGALSKDLRPARPRWAPRPPPPKRPR